MANGTAGQTVTPEPTKITQIAVVARDMEAALTTYTETLGWAPWSVFDYKPPLLHDTQVKGEAVEYRMIGAETSVDGLRFELIQPVSGPSIYQEFLDAHGEGVQHIACMKHSEEDSSQVREHWHANGAEVLKSGRIGRLDRVLLPGHRPHAEVCARIRQRACHRPQADLRVPMTWADPVRILIFGQPLTSACTFARVLARLADAMIGTHLQIPDGDAASPQRTAQPGYWPGHAATSRTRSTGQARRH
jgi:methylmalonyl-CoA/ethylmalonyl-CoA epimerase